MKKLFYAITAATVVGTSVVPVGVFANNQVSEFDYEIQYHLNSFRNIILFVNSESSKDKEKVKEMEKSSLVNQVIDDVTGKFYQQFFDNKEGQLDSLKDTDQEATVQKFSDAYTNNTEQKQIFKTKEYSKTIINNHSFSVSALEKINAKISFKVPFLNNKEMKVDLNSEQNWNDAILTEEQLVNSSQEFTVNPFSVGKAEYTVKQETHFNEGVIRIPVDFSLESFEIPLFSVNENGTWEKYGVKKWDGFIVLALVVLYEEETSINYDNYSLISVTFNKDTGNIDEFYLNLPITWTSQGGKLDVNFSETPL